MDLSHHLSLEAQRRQPSLAKSLYTYMLNPQIASLGGGLPAASMFPIKAATFQVPLPQTDSMNGEMTVKLWPQLGPEGETSTVSLEVAQQYAAGSGFPQLISLIEKFSSDIHQPPTSGQHEVTLTLGNTDGLSKMQRLLLNPGENMLFEEFVFSPPVENARAMGCGLVPVRLDSEGIDATSLDGILSSWRSDLSGPKPRVLYTVTCGQNPTGTTASLERLRAIYTVAQKHDLIVIEDDPYFFLQLGTYHPGRRLASQNGLLKRSTSNAQVKGIGGQPIDPVTDADSVSTLAKSLAPGLISLDVDGRVVRLDSFSKVVFPGARLGWITLNHLFRERFERLSEVTTQMGNGINQAFFAQLLTPPSATSSNAGGWGSRRFVTWINRVRHVYSAKRDFCLDVLNRECPPDTGYVSCVAPEAGMFLWIKIHLEKHPRFVRNASSRPQTNTACLMEELFEKVLANNALVLPARFFAVPHTLPAGFKAVPGSETYFEDLADRSNYLRATFAGSEETIEKALVRFGQSLKEFFKE